MKRRALPQQPELSFLTNKVGPLPTRSTQTRVPHHSCLQALATWETSGRCPLAPRGSAALAWRVAMDTLRTAARFLRGPSAPTSSRPVARRGVVAPRRRVGAVVCTLFTVSSLGRLPHRSPAFAFAQPTLLGADDGLCERGSRLCAARGGSAITEELSQAAAPSHWKELELDSPEELQALVDRRFGEGLDRVARATPPVPCPHFPVTDSAASLLTLSPTHPSRPPATLCPTPRARRSSSSSRRGARRAAGWPPSSSGSPPSSPRSRWHSSRRAGAATASFHAAFG